MLATYQFVLLGAVLGCYLIGLAVEAYIWGQVKKLPAEVQYAAWQRAARWDGLLRALDILGIAGIIIGVMRNRGYFSALPLSSRILLAAIAVFCLERALRGWISWRAVSREEGARALSRSSFTAALLATIVQLILFACVGWWVCTHITPVRRAATPSDATANEGANGEGIQGNTPAPDDRIVWVTESRALEILGKDKAYLDLLVPYDEIPTLTKAGQKWYRKDFLERRREAGLPGIEELKAAAKLMDNAKSPSIKPAQPPKAGPPKAEPTTKNAPRPSEDDVLKE
jgi:hypothetical protein